MGSGSDSTMAALRLQEEERAALINQGVGRINTAFEGYNPAFYSGVRDNTIATLLPQLMRQYQQQQQALGTGVAERGLLQSSVARNARTSLDRQLGLNQLAVANQGIQAANEVQQQVSNQKSNLINQLQASANPSLAAQRAVESASAISLPSMLAPLGNMFQDWSRNYAAGAMNQAYQGNNQPGILGALGFRTQTAPIGKNYTVGG
jgi:hypothetical protein